LSVVNSAEGAKCNSPAQRAGSAAVEEQPSAESAKCDLCSWPIR